jgi:hypothetical protein
MTPILLRYADADASYGEHLLSTLTQAGLTISAAPAPATRQRAAAETQASQAVVVVWSRQALRSPALLLQAAMAKAQGKLVAARIEPGLAAPGKAEVVDLTDWRRGFAALTAYLLQPPAAPAGAATSATTAAGQWSEPKTRSAKPAKSGGWLWGALLLAVGSALAGLALLGKLG